MRSVLEALLCPFTFQPRTAGKGEQHLILRFRCMYGCTTAC